MLHACARKERASSLELAFDARFSEIEKAWRNLLSDILYPAGAEPGGDLLDTGERPSPLEQAQSSLRRRLDPEPEVDLHNLELELDDSAASEPRSDFDPDFEDPFAGEPRIRRGAGLRSPSREELPPAPKLDFGPPPEFGFEGSGGREVEEDDDREGDEGGAEDPER